MTSLLLYTDGSCRGNGPNSMGGYSVIILNSRGDAVIDKIISPRFSNTNSFVMELQALNASMDYLLHHNFLNAVIFTDNQEIVDNYNKKLNKWIGSGFLDVKNLEIWKNIGRIKQKIGNKVDVVKIKAHQKRSNFNNEADRLAKFASSYKNTRVKL